MCHLPSSCWGIRGCIAAGSACEAGRNMQDATCPCPATSQGHKQEADAHQGLYRKCKNAVYCCSCTHSCYARCCQSLSCDIYPVHQCLCDVYPACFACCCCLVLCHICPVHDACVMCTLCTVATCLNTQLNEVFRTTSCLFMLCCDSV